LCFHARPRGPARKWTKPLVRDPAARHERQPGTAAQGAATTPKIRAEFAPTPRVVHRAEADTF